MRVRRTAAVIGVLATVAAVAGCSTGPDVVAEVEGTTITEADLDRVIDELGPLVTDSSRGGVLTALIQAEVGLTLAEPNGVEVTEDEAAKFLTEQADLVGVEARDWGEGSLVIAQRHLLAVDLGNAVGVEAANAQFLEALAGADVTVSPRYGEFDPAVGAVVALHPAWIVDPAAAEPAAG